MNDARLPGTLLLICGLMLSGCSRSSPETASAESDGAGTAAVRPLVDYRNGLSDAERREFYHLSEGGEIIPLSILQALERAPLPQEQTSQPLVPFLQNMERYGFIPDDPDKEHNPFGLPVGMTVARTRLFDTPAVGFNCSACHVGELWDESGRRVRVDGAPNLIRLNDMFADLKAELDATIRQTGRRGRFLASALKYRLANNQLLPTERTLSERAQTLTQDIEMAKALFGYMQAMPTLRDMATGIQNGYARVDAFGVARNLLFGSNPKNLRPQNAPVSLAYIWGIETTAWLQWGANTNSVMERNIGQSLGVGAVFNLADFSTTSRLDNLNKMEHLAYKLSPPEWPADVFGPIDGAKAAAGRELYLKQCATCHERPLEVTPSGLVVDQLFTLKEVGTSPFVAQNFDVPVLVDGKEVPFATAAFRALEEIKQAYYRRNNISPEVQAEWEVRSRRPPPMIRSTLADADKYPDSKGGRVYRARPLAGIWATAPYLNNGSVANMWDLLTVPAQRPTRFTLGSREFDAQRLGYRSTADPSSPAPPWEFDATLPYNTNAGHVYGTNRTDEEKWALIEFLKVLRPGEIRMEPVRRASGTATN